MTQSNEPSWVAPRPPRDRALQVVYLATILAASAALFVRSPVDASPLTVAAVAVGLVLSIAFALGLHELGHLLAGELVGWQWEVFKTGPFLLLRTDGSIRLTVAADPRYRGAGLVVSRLRRERSGGSVHEALFLAGGPVMSLVLSALAFTAWWRLDGAPRLQLGAGLMGVASTVILVSALLPIRSSGHLSDGAKIIEVLWRRGVDGTESCDA